MKTEVSAGGVVLVGNAILMLKKYNGDWVLPKGRQKLGEELEKTALREVNEESGAKAEIRCYLGSIKYTLNFGNPRRECTEKTVHWYLMTARNMDCIPLKKEGFVEAKYIPVYKAIEAARYDDERTILEKAAEIYEEEHQGK